MNVAGYGERKGTDKSLAKDAKELSSQPMRVGHFLRFLCQHQSPDLSTSPKTDGKLCDLRSVSGRAFCAVAAVQAPRQAEPERKQGPPTGWRTSDCTGLAKFFSSSASPLFCRHVMFVAKELREAWAWEMPYSFAQQLQATCFASGAAQEALQAVRDALNTKRWRFHWGELQASWRRLVLDAALLQRCEESDCLQLLRASRGAAGPLPGEVETQLADCQAELQQLLSSDAVEMSATAFATWLAQQQLPLAPVTLFAAARVEPDSVQERRGLLKKDICEVQAVEGSAGGCRLSSTDISVVGTLAW